MSLYNTIKKAAMGAILTGSIALGTSGLENKLQAQVEPPKVEWEKTFGGSGVDTGDSVQQTTDGGYIIGGTISHFLVDENDRYSIHLIKTDTNGEKQWENIFGGEEAGYLGDSVQQTTDGGYVIGGATDLYG